MKGNDKEHSDDIWKVISRGKPSLDSLSAVIVSNDGMECRLTLDSEFKASGINEILDLLTERGITYGIDKTALIKLVREGVSSEKIIIARGKEPVKGKPAEVKYCYRLPDEYSCSDREKACRPFQYAKKNELLVVKFRTTRGVAGKDVYGLPVEPEPGDKLDFIAGKNVQQRFFPDKIEFSALCDGLIKTGENRVDIESLFIVESDIDGETGSIEFPGNILVKGDVCKGGSVTSRGSMTIEGNVKSGIVQAGGYLEVKGKIDGDAQVKTSGKLRVNRAVSSLLVAGNDLEIMDMAVECHIKTGGWVRVLNPSGTIAGGEVQTPEGVDTPSLGSPRIKKTTVTLSVIDELPGGDQTSQAVRRIDEEMMRINDQIRNMRANPLDRYGKSNTWKQKSLEKRLFRLNQQRYEFEKRMNRAVQDDNTNSRIPRIFVRKRLYPMVKLRTDKSQFVLDHSLDRVEIFPNNETGEWQVTGLDHGR